MKVDPLKEKIDLVVVEENGYNPCEEYLWVEGCGYNLWEQDEESENNYDHDGHCKEMESENSYDLVCNGLCDESYIYRGYDYEICIYRLCYFFDTRVFHFY